MTQTTKGAGAWDTLRRGLALSPRLRRGLPVTVSLGLVGTLGKVLVPVGRLVLQNVPYDVLLEQR